MKVYNTPHNQKTLLAIAHTSNRKHRSHQTILLLSRSLHDRFATLRSSWLCALNSIRQSSSANSPPWYSTAAMAALAATRMARAHVLGWTGGQVLGCKLRSSPAMAFSISERSFYSMPSSRNDVELPGIRPRKEVRFPAMAAFVGAAAAISSWHLGLASHAVHTEAAKGALDPNAWLSLKVATAEELNHNTKRFRFSFEDSEAVSGLHVASCLLTRAPTGETDKDGKPDFVIRPYTPVTSPDVKGYFELVIKIYPQGKMTQHLAKLKEGDTLEVKGPIPKIPYSPNLKKNIGMIAGGTGITPMYQVIQEILSNPEDKTQVSLLYANNTLDDILLKKELDALVQSHPNFKVYYVLSEKPEGWNGGVGHINLDMVVKGLPPPTDDNIVFVCGPPGMMKAISGDKVSPKDQGEVSGVLNQAGYSKQQVYKF